jgi:LPXTG-site transpeptidase (sortase) family protein
MLKKSLYVTVSIAVIIFAGINPSPATARVPRRPPNCSSTTSSFSSNPRAAIPELEYFTSTITVSGLDTYLFDLDLTTFIRHTWNADLTITLESPVGTVSTITSNNGEYPDVFNGTLWDDDGVTLVTDYNTFTGAGVVSPLVPEGAMGAFIGEDPNGDWKLTIYDDFIGDTGTLDQWRLDITTLASPPTTSTATFSVTVSPPLTIPFATYVNSKIQVSGLDSYLLDIDLTTFIQHPVSYGLWIFLESPAGNHVIMTMNNGDAYENVYDGTLWDDNGNIPVTDYPYASDGPVSPLVPEEAMSAFIGEDPNGDWSLTMFNTWRSDTGSLDRWDLNIVTGACPVPEHEEPEDPGAVEALPDTGFAPGFITSLPDQPAEKVYTNHSDLWMDIPKLSVSMPIVGVPFIDGEWDVSWLGNSAGYLEGTAFPTTAGNTGITAHVWDANNNPGPFVNLKSLQYGDAVEIHAWGYVYIYSVRSNYLTTPGNTTPLHHEDYDWVMLLTCERYSSTSDNYRFRRVVRAVLVDVRPE